MKIKEKEFEEILQELKAVADQLGASIRFEKGDFKGGYCIVHDKKVIVINKMTNLQKKVMILSTALKELGVDSIYLSPRIREVIEEMSGVS
ncbi:MAG: hypothetical protein HXY48_04470 [Ignavibacteriaceae bacterium]|jgi:hypothetical protein|nr:hypothetical protein [Ignavibacteriaceae bacterium]